MQRSSQRGFTLIELLVVIAIIGLLASTILASLNTARSKGRDARRTADLKSIQLANELYFDSNSTYSTSTALLAPTYISAIPSDPNGGSLAYAYVGLQGSAGAVATCGSYHLGALMENSSATALSAKANKAAAGAYPTADGVNCTSSSWTTTTQFTAVSSGGTGNDFQGTVTSVYDIRP